MKVIPHLSDNLDELRMKTLTNRVFQPVIKKSLQLWMQLAYSKRYVVALERPSATTYLKKTLNIVRLASVTVVQKGCIWRKANISVGAKHDLREYGIITNNLYAVMLLQASKVRCALQKLGL
jgi:hypothetical protein